MVQWRNYMLALFAMVCGLLCALLTGCFFPPPDLEVQVIHYPGFEQHHQDEGCEDIRALNSIQILEVGEPLPNACQQVGDVFIGDSSTSYPCEPQDLIDQLRQAACEEGIAITQIIHITSPRGGSSCHQLRAALLSCE
jgi:hypothetical protein